MRRLTGTTFFGRSSWIHLGAGLLSALLMFPLRPLLFGEVVRVWELLGAGAVLVAIYAGLLYLVGELSRADLAVAQDAMHPRRMVAYVREEMRDKRVR